MKHVLLAGATGLVGTAVMDHADPDTVQITTVGRRATKKVANEVISNFDADLTLPGGDVAICALGTTIADAGSKAAFRAIDHDAVLTFAGAAQSAGIKHFIVVSSVGADPGATIFYSRVKGETERDLQALDFMRLDIVQPGLLLGERTAHRPVELMLKRMDRVARHFMLGPLNRYAGIHPEAIGRALLALTGKKIPGVYRHTNQALLSLSRE